MTGSDRSAVGCTADTPPNVLRVRFGRPVLGWRLLLTDRSGAASNVPNSAPPAAGLGPLRPAPTGLEIADLAPPVTAESGDPFSTWRILDLVARLERGAPQRLTDIVDRLNATHLDWIFGRRVVEDVLLQLQANWIADYRNSSGIVIDDGPSGASVTIEDSTRVDPWIVRLVAREADACRELLRDFSRRDRVTGDG